MMDAHDSYWRTCFVMMPYGIRELNGQSIDFDWIYSTIFKPAIQNVKVNGKRLIPRRADEYGQSRLLIHRMIQDLLNSRLGLADLTTHNPNVHYELGARQALLPSGTILVCMTGVTIPFDLRPVLITEYEYIPPEEVKVSIQKISRVLRETLRHNEMDSPVYAVAREFAQRMGPAEQPTSFGIAVVEAEEAVLHGDPDRGGALYAKAVRLEPEIALVHQRQGSLLMESGRLDEAQNALGMAFVLNLPEATKAKFKDQFAEMSILAASELFEGSVMQRGDIDVEIRSKPGGLSQIDVLSDPMLYWTDTVSNILSQHVEVKNRDVKWIPQVGRVLSRYDVADNDESIRSASIHDLTTHLKGWSGLGEKLNVRFVGTESDDSPKNIGEAPDVNAG